MSDPSLRAAYQSAVEKNAPTNRDGCPGAEALSALAASTHVGDHAAESAMLEHVLACARCRPEFGLLRVANVATQGDSRWARTPFTMQQVGLAAALLLAVGIGGEAWRQSQQAETRATPLDAADVVLVSPLAGQVPPGRFVWRAVRGAAAYQWEVLDSAGTAVLQGTTSDTTVQLSPTDSATVARLSLFDWMVTARRSDGNERRSALVRVRGPLSERR